MVRAERSLTVRVANLAESTASSLAAPSPLVLEDFWMPELDLGRRQFRNLGLNERQQFLAVGIIADLQQERTVFFQLAKLPPNAEFWNIVPSPGPDSTVIILRQPRSHGR